MKISKKITALLITLILLITMTVMPMNITAQSDSIESVVKQAFETYVLEKGNEVTQEGIIAAVEEAVGHGKTVTLNSRYFYIKHAVDGVKDEDPNEQTQINISGSDGAVAATVVVDGVSYGLTAVIKHTVENLGYLEIAILGYHDDDDVAGMKVVNWIGNYDPNKKYKIVLPENTSQIRTDQYLTLAGENADNIVAMVIKDHKADNFWNTSSPRYSMFTNLRAVVMADTLTSFPSDAFSDCKQLKYVHISEGLVRTIPARLFKNCSALENINFPNGITGFIEAEAFYGTALREVVYTGTLWNDDVFGAPSFTEGTRNIIKSGTTTMTFPQAAAYSVAAVSELDYTEAITAEDIENTAKSVWTSKSINYTLSWPDGWDSDATDNVIGGTLRLTKTNSRDSWIYDINFAGYFYEEALREAVSAFVAENGNSTTCEKLLSGVITALSSLTDDIKLSKTDFYIKHAVNGVVDEDPDEKTRINIEGSDGAVAAIFEINGKRVGATAVIRHEVENLGLLEIVQLGDYEDPDDSSKRIINWIGNHDSDTNYKIVLPEDTSYINVDGLTYANDNTENVVALVMLGHKEKLPRYNKLSNLKVVVMSDNITGTEEYDKGTYTEYLSQNFAGMTKLKYVHISQNWQSVIAWGMFKDCPALENVNIPSSIEGIEDLAFSGTALREIEHPNVWVQNNPFADPNLDEGEAGRNVTVLGADMIFIKAAAYAQCGALTANFKSFQTADDVTSAILSNVFYSGNLETDWNGTFTFNIGDPVVSGTLTVTNSRGDSIPISFSRLLSKECGLSSLKVKYFEITPAFDTNTVEYKLSVPNSVTHLTVTAETVNVNATVGTISGADDLPTGESEIIIPVTAQNGETVNYKITVTRSAVEDPDDTPENRFINSADSIISTNDTTENVLSETLTDIVHEDAYSVKINDFYKLDAINGAKDQDGIIVPAYNGYVVAFASLYKGDTEVVEISIVSTIEGNYEEFTFATVSTEDDFEISSDGTTLLSYSGSAEKVIIPDGVEEIDELWMIGDPSAIRALILPESLRITPASMCWGMSNLAACYMGNQVTEAGGMEFNNCYKLRYVHLSEQLENIGSGMFMHTFALADLHIPSTVNTIGNQSFFNSFIRDLTLSGNIEVIWEDAFSWLSHNPKLFGGGNAWGVKIPETIMQEVGALIADDLDRQVLITVINSEVKYPRSLSSYQTDGTGAWSDITLRSVKASTTYEHYTDYKTDGFYFNECDMTITEAFARAKRIIDTLYIDNSSTEIGLEQAIQNAYYGTKISDEIVWTEALSIIPATKQSAGHASGTLVIKDTDGNEFELTLDRDFSLAPEQKKKDSNSIIITNDSNNGLFDTETQGNGSIINNENTDTNTENAGSKTVVKVKKIRKNKGSDGLAVWLIVVLIIVGVLVVAAIILIIILILKKRKKKVQAAEIAEKKSE